MAIYHLHCDIIGRSGGRSAVAAAAYRATCKIKDRTTGEIFDFRKKEKAVLSQILTDGNVPKWANDRAELWNSCEEKESRKNSQFCRSFDIALMKELSLADNYELIRKWAKENYVSRGLVADIAIHAPHKNRDGTTNENLHAHVLIPTRKMTKDGWGKKDREGNDREFLKRVRKSWAETVNAKFRELGMGERIDERTLEEQGIDREPQQHLGATATAMQRKGKQTDRQKYKSRKQKIAPEISEKEIEGALENDAEIKKLEEARKKILAERSKPKVPPEYKEWLEKISEMSPKGWQSFMRYSDEAGLRYEVYGEYRKNLIDAEARAQNIWVERNISGITKIFEEDFKKAKAECEAQKARKPTPIAKRPNKLEAFFLNYRTDKGEVYHGRDYDQYRMKQQALINEWEHGKSLAQNELDARRQSLKDCREKKYSRVRAEIKRDYPMIFRQMKDGAIKILSTVEQFRPVRAMVSAVKRLRGRKDAELDAWRHEQKRARERSRDDGYGWDL